MLVEWPKLPSFLFLFESTLLRPAVIYDGSLVCSAGPGYNTTFSYPDGKGQLLVAPSPWIEAGWNARSDHGTASCCPIDDWSLTGVFHHVVVVALRVE